jgi:hypothetical protein
LENYSIGDVLSASNADLGGTGSGLTITVDGDGDGQIVVVAAGVYQEIAPIQIKRRNVSIIGQALRSCLVHPTIATENNTLFELNSGSYVSQLTLTGVKAGSGTGNALDPDLPTTQGWNFAFYNDAFIVKSPYIQNCTNFSDSEINNNNLNAHNPAGGTAGDLDSAPTGGGLLINGATPHDNSPLRSMVCDSYTHVGLNGPGILVVNNGYCQATSSYAFFNKYHIKCRTGGQANLAASTTDFGEKALVADGKSSSAIFTSNVDGAIVRNVDNEPPIVSFNINAPTADASWHGTATRPQGNMLVEVTHPTSGTVIYPVLSAVAHTDAEGGAGWTVTISRPNTNNRSINDGLEDDIDDDAAVSFYLRSQIASSGHTMEYVGSGMDYRALPENGGVPDDTKQINETNGGKIWTATTDQNGKFSVGDFFNIDQRTGFVSFSAGSVAFDLVTDSTPELGGNLDTGNFTITGLPATPTIGTEATSKTYVDNQVSTVSSAVSTNSNAIATNASNITTNASAISTNTSNITTNASAISTNASNITTNASAISTNASNITANASAISTNTSNITNNTTAIGTKLSLSGGTMTGDIVFNSGQDIDGFVPEVASPVAGGGATTTGAADIPKGTDAQRPESPSTPADPADLKGYFRFNTTSNEFEGHDGTAWGAIGGSGGGGGATGGGPDTIFQENKLIVTTDYTIGTNIGGSASIGTGASCVGPITVNAGKTLTVPANARLVVL